MTKLNKLLPACGFVIAVALVGITSAFTDAVKPPQDVWVLNTGASIGSTTPSDYHLDSKDCNGTVTFCGFEAPESTTTSGEPDIAGVDQLTEDLEALQQNPNSQRNESEAVHFQL